jgi:hypothetical protein
MSFSASQLIRWSGFATILAGVLTALFWFLHPGLGDPSAALTARWMWVNLSFVFLLILTLYGVTGLYARQSDRVGTLGFVSYLLSFTSTSLFVGAGIFDAVINPVLRAESPALLNPDGPLLAGPLGIVFMIAGVSFALGFVLFGVTTFRAGIFPVGAAVLLIIGSPILGFSPLMPQIARTLGSVVFGASFIWLGYANSKLDQ